MNIIITGKIGIGKTTVCERVMKLLRENGITCGGILTHKVIDKGEIIGIEVEDIQSGKKSPLASTREIYQGPRTGKYFFNPGGIKSGIEAIAKGVSSDLLIIDEIGFLEWRGEGFAYALESVKSEKVKKSILVVRTGLLPLILVQLSREPQIFEVTLGNRDELPQKIYNCFKEDKKFNTINLKIR